MRRCASWCCLLFLTVAGCGGGEAAGLRVERSAPPVPGVDVYVEEDSQNVPETARGKATVTVECLDQAGRAVARAQQPWPFTDTDDGQLAPHVHITLPPQEAQRVRRCRLAGTRGPLEGEVKNLR